MSALKSAIKRNWMIYLFLGLVGVAGFNGLFFLGIKYTTPINGSLIMGTNPLVTLILAAIFLKEPVTTNQRVGVLFSLIGVLVVITNGSLDQLMHLKIAFGDWVIIGANLCWASYSVAGRRYLKESKPLITTAITMIIGSIILLCLVIPGTSFAQLIDQSKPVYAALMYTVFFGTVLAYLFWNYGIKHLGASKTAVFFNIVPIVAVIHSIIMGHAIYPVQIAGGLCVIFGVLLSINIINLPYRTQIKPLNSSWS